MRKVAFLDLTPLQGERMADFCRRLDAVGEVADMEKVSLPKLNVIRVTQSCTDKDLKRKLFELKESRPVMGKGQGDS